MHRRLPILIILLALIVAAPAQAWESGGVEIHGFASTGYIKTDHNNFLLSSEDGSFEFNEVGINFGTAIAKNMRVGIQLYSFDLGNIGNNDVKLDWAFLDYSWKEWLGVRVGKLKTPFGLYNETQDYDMLRTCILLPQSIYSTYLRESRISTQGIALYGQIPLSSAGHLKYDFCFGTSEISSGGGVSKIFSIDGLTFESARIKYLGSSRLTWVTPLKGLKMGASSTLLTIDSKGILDLEILLGPTMTITTSVNVDASIENQYLYILFIEYDYGDLTMATEYYYRHSETTIKARLSEAGLPPQRPTETTIDTAAFYALLSYRLCPWLELGTYYSIFCQEQNHQSDYLLNTMKDLAISARFDINQSWLIKAEVHFWGGAGQLVSVDNPGKDNNYEPNWMLFAIKTTFNF